MEIPTLIDYLGALRPEFKSLSGNQPVAFSKNIIEEDFKTILTKLISEKISPQLIKGMTGWADIDDGLFKTSITEAAQLIEDLKEDIDVVKASDYLAAAIVEAMKLLGKIEGINGFLDDFLQNADTKETDLFIHDAQNIEIKAEAAAMQSKDAKELSDSGVSKDIKNLIQKSFLELRSDIRTVLNSESGVETKASENAKVPGGSRSIHSFENIAETMSDAKKANGLTDDAKMPTLKQDIVGSSNKEVNALNTKDSDLTAKETLTTIHAKTLSDLPNGRSDQRESNYQGQNSRVTISEHFPASSGQAFSSVVNKAVIEEVSMPAQQIVRLDAPNAGVEKLMILNSHEKYLKLSIEPDGIGMLDIELTLERGVINAQIFASESAGKNFLDNNISAILSSLLREGLDIGKFSISLGHKRDDSKQEQGESTRKNQNSPGELDLINNPAKHRLISIFV